MNICRQCNRECKKAYDVNFCEKFTPIKPPVYDMGGARIAYKGSKGKWVGVLKNESGEIIFECLFPRKNRVDSSWAHVSAFDDVAKAIENARRNSRAWREYAEITR